MTATAITVDMMPICAKASARFIARSDEEGEGGIGDACCHSHDHGGKAQDHEAAVREGLGQILKRQRLADALNIGNARGETPCGNKAGKADQSDQSCRGKIGRAVSAKIANESRGGGRAEQHASAGKAVFPGHKLGALGGIRRHLGELGQIGHRKHAECRHVDTESQEHPADLQRLGAMWHGEDRDHRDWCQQPTDQQPAAARKARSNPV
ncbi:hypothetical protein OKA06_05565 [Novosphingobium sp. MW5]|nr:hypothetical protein [Novosphingobium sp. MW5]